MACGVFEGMLRHGWVQAGVKLIAVETVGADCFHESVKQGRCVTLSSITSIAKTLGAKKCADRLFALWTEYPDSFVSLRVTDKEAVEACCKFLGLLCFNLNITYSISNSIEEFFLFLKMIKKLSLNRLVEPR